MPDLGWQTGYTCHGKRRVKLLYQTIHNNGDSTFLDLGIAFPRPCGGSADVIDFTNGIARYGYLRNDGNPKTVFAFQNKGNNLFFRKSRQRIPGVDGSTVNVPT